MPTPSTVDIDYGSWRHGVTTLLHGGAFSGGIGEMWREKHKGNHQDMGTEHFNATYSAADQAMMQNTDLLAQMNASYSSNHYMASAVLAERTRVGKLDAKAKRDVYKLREQSLGVVYSEDLSKFLTTVTRVVLLAAMLVVAVLSATSQNMITKRTGVFLGVSVVVIIGAVITLMIGNAGTRRNDSWGHYYWNVSGSAVQGSSDKCAT